jgi:hypothetical protein
MNTQNGLSANPAKQTVILFVTHRGLDWDARVGVFLWLIVYGFTQLYRKGFSLCFDFVPAGCRVSPQALLKFQPDIVVHLDTGRVHNKATHDYDHHPPDQNTVPDFDCTPDVLWVDYPEELTKYPWLEDLRYVTRLVDTGRFIYTRTQEDYELQKVLNQDLVEANVTELKLVDSLEPLRNMVNLSYNMLCPDYDMMMTGLINLFAWHESLRPKTERTELANQAVVQTNNSVTFGTLPPTDIFCDDMRNHLRCNRQQYPWDVFFYCKPDDPKIGITCLTDKAKPYMDKLFVALREKYPYFSVPTELFLHARRFVIYIPLSQEDYPTIIEMAMSILGAKQT